MVCFYDLRERPFYCKMTISSHLLYRDTQVLQFLPCDNKVQMLVDCLSNAKIHSEFIPKSCEINRFMP